MNVTAIDTHLAKTNPWGLGAHQCFVLRMLLTYGTSKAVVWVTETPQSTIEYHLQRARAVMGGKAQDVRHLIEFATFMRGRAWYAKRMGWTLPHVITNTPKSRSAKPAKGEKHV